MTIQQLIKKDNVRFDRISLSKEEISELVFSLHSYKLKALIPYKKGIIRFLRFALKTNPKDVKWFICHIIDYLAVDADNTFLKDISTARNINKISRELSAQLKSNQKLKSEGLVFTESMFWGNGDFPLKKETQRANENKTYSEFYTKKEMKKYQTKLETL